MVLRVLPVCWWETKQKDAMLFYAMYAVHNKSGEGGN